MRVTILSHAGLLVVHTGMRRWREVVEVMRLSPRRTLRRRALSIEALYPGKAS